jgi:hypothetical protein
MTTIIINERTKAGKTMLELAKMLSASNKGVSFGTDFPQPDSQKELTTKQKSWINRLKKIQSDVKVGTYEGQSAQSFLDEL